MVKRLVEIDQDALAEAAELLGTAGAQETVAAALTELSDLYLQLKESEEAKSAQESNSDHPV